MTRGAPELEERLPPRLRLSRRKRHLDRIEVWHPSLSARDVGKRTESHQADHEGRPSPSEPYPRSHVSLQEQRVCHVAGLGCRPKWRAISPQWAEIFERGRGNPSSEATGYKQPVVKLPRHSTGARARLAALLLGRICPIFSLVAPGDPGFSPLSVPRASFTTGC